MRRLWPLLLLCACSQGPAIAPGRIVSNNPCIDAVLAEVADPATIGAVSIYSHDPASGSAPIAWARRFPPIGADAEELIAARPRLVLSGNYASTGTNAALARAGIEVHSFGVPATLKDSEEQVAAIAHAIGREPQGKALAERMERAIAPVTDGRTAIIWTSGGFVAGRGTIQDEMLGRAGFQNASATYGLKQWGILPLETLIRRPPDVIFTPAAAKGDDARALALRQRVLRHLAGRTEIVALPDRLLNCGGPSVIEAMRIFKAKRRK
jgi:iron complex transport system substrate-binding protein